MTSFPPDNAPVLVETTWGEVLLCQRQYRHGLNEHKWTITGTEIVIPASSITDWWHYNKKPWTKEKK